MLLRLLAVLAAVAAGGTPVRAETCRFSGVASQNGQVTARAEATESAGLLSLDISITLKVHVWLADYQVLAQELTTWRGGELQSVAVNNRSVVDGEPRRQQWDVWARTGAGLVGHRVQAKTEADFRRAHPAFLGHWPQAAFPKPWLADYAAAAPVRRPDLDLPTRALPARLRTPLALAFYWSRYLPQGGAAVPVFLPGWKRDARVDVALAPATDGPGWRRWSAPLRHPALDSGLAGAWVSPDHYLLQLGLEARSGLGAGQAILRAEGCQGVQLMPPGQPPS